MSTVEKYPGAAGALAAHIRRKSYGARGIPVGEDPPAEPDSARALLPYLDRVSVAAGMRPGVVPGVV